MLDLRDEDFNPQHMQTEMLEIEYREKLFSKEGYLKNL